MVQMCTQTSKCQDKPLCSVHPLREVVAALEWGTDRCGVHRLVLGQVLRVLPLKELFASLSVRCTAEVAVCCGDLILGLSQCKRHSERAGAGIKLHLDDVCDVLGCQPTLFSAIGLHE